MGAPRLTVCIPSYNSGRFLPAAIESVLRQSFADFELLIIDDCSTDNTVEVASAYARRDGRIRLSVNERNLGMVKNWNRCLAEARGGYVKYLFGDDTLDSPLALERMVELLDRDDGVSLVASSRHVIDQDGRIVETKGYFPDDLVIEGSEVINLSFLEHNNIIGEPSVVMFRKAHGARGFDPRYRQIVDLEMWFHLLERGRFAFLAEPLCAFREHGEQQTRRNFQELAHVDDYALLCGDYLRKSYVTFNPLTKWLLFYYQLYNVWKISRQGKCSDRIVREKIARYCGTVTFFCALPLYKAYNPIFKLAKRRVRARFRQERRTAGP